MKCHQRHTLAALLASMSLVSQVLAADRTAQAAPSFVGEAQALSPTQLAAIRGVSRNVLAAKKSGSEDSADAAQLVSLRASLDLLIAADLDPDNRAPVTVQGQESSEQRRSREKVARLRESARIDARAVAGQLRSRAEIKTTQARSAPEEDTRSAGLPIGEQRARLFERWAQKLDAALADGNADRTSELRALREQLRTTHGSLNDAPITHGTPTLQAMPAGFVPPKQPNQVPNQSDGAAKQ